MIKNIYADSDFLAQMNIIDYSLLLGEILTDSVDKFKTLISETPDLDRGVFISNKNRIFIMGIIDPLTGFSCMKNLEYQFKKIKYGH